MNFKIPPAGEKRVRYIASRYLAEIDSNEEFDSPAEFLSQLFCERSDLPAAFLPRIVDMCDHLFTYAIRSIQRGEVFDFVDLDKHLRHAVGYDVATIDATFAHTTNVGQLRAAMQNFTEADVKTATIEVTTYTVESNGQTIRFEVDEECSVRVSVNSGEFNSHEMKFGITDRTFRYGRGDFMAREHFAAEAAAIVKDGRWTLEDRLAPVVVSGFESDHLRFATRDAWESSKTPQQRADEESIADIDTY